jgi:methyl-accepting chemotaxis protein
MVGLKSLSITAKLVVLMTTAVVVPVVVGWYGLQDQNKLGAVAQEHVVLEQANSALNHLDTRESELKVSAHRGLVEPDVAAIEADLVDDGATINEIVAQLDALPLPAALRAEIVAVNPDVAAFTAFVGEFLRDARLHPAATLSREGEIDERNHVIDDKLGAIHEKLDAAGVQTRQREVAASRWAWRACDARSSGDPGHHPAVAPHSLGPRVSFRPGSNTGGHFASRPRHAGGR